MNIQELPISIETFITIKDLDTGKILVEGSNAIHQENMSVALSLALARLSGSFISEMHFGSGAAIIATDGVITYRKPNIVGVGSDLYTPTYFKVVDDSDINRVEGSTDGVTIQHNTGSNYSDVIVTATLANNEPLAVDSIYNTFDATSSSLDATTIYDGEFEFNEIGLKTKGSTGLNSGNLLTHFIFHPVQKNADQTIQIVYTLRVRAG
jgi:hypothetical protein